MDADNISRSSASYRGKLRTNQSLVSLQESVPKVPTGSYSIAQVAYELNVLGTRGPRKMHCLMHSIPVSALEAGGSVPGQAEPLAPGSLDYSFRSVSFSNSSSSIMLDRSMDFSGSRFSDMGSSSIVRENGEESERKVRPLVLWNKAPRWHEQLQCWCLNFRGRVTVASVKNFQLIAATQQPAARAPTPSSQHQHQHLQCWHENANTAVYSSCVGGNLI